MNDDEKNRLTRPAIQVDFETAALLEALEDEEADDIDAVAKAVELYPDKFSPDSLMAYAKLVGKQDDPQMKALIQAARERRGGPAP